MMAQVAGWLQQPFTPPGCPPGLEYLAGVDQLLIHQQTELIEGAYIPIARHILIISYRYVPCLMVG